MCSLALFALATPIFGLSLTPPSLCPSPPPVVRALDPQGELAAADPAVTRPRPARPAPRYEFRSIESERNEELAAAILQRETIRPVHLAFGIATWAAMAATAALGLIQIYDEYGFWEDPASTPCARGDAVLGFCGGDTPWPHAIAAATTTALYATTFALSFFMPDPLDVAHQHSPAGERLRIHRALRWVHLAGMIAVLTLGIVTASADLDYDTRRVLAWAHFGSAAVTFGTLTAAGAIMLF